MTFADWGLISPKTPSGKTLSLLSRFVNAIGVSSAVGTLLGNPDTSLNENRMF